MRANLRRFALSVLAWLPALTLATATAYIIVLSRALRPVADDYRIAASVASQGVLGAIDFFWSTWVGDVFSWTSNVLFVGVPLAFLPLPFASAVAFLVAALSVAIAATVLVTRTMDKPSAQWLTLAPLALSLPALWWAYFWTASAFGNASELSSNLAAAIAMWPTINAQYVIPIAILTLAWFLLSRTTSWSLTVRLVLYAGLGLLVGLTGVVLAVSLITFLPLLALGRFIMANRVERLEIYSWSSAVLGTSLGALVSHKSPGSTERMSLLNEPTVSFDFILAVLRSMPRAVLEWGGGVWNPGAVVVLAVTCALGVIATLRGARVNAVGLAASGTALIALSLITSIWNRVSEFFSYEAFWHVLQVREITWMGLVALGFSLGHVVAKPSTLEWLTPSVLFAGGIGVILSLAAIATMSNAILVRYEQWSQGPAPFADIGDIETDWVREAWQELGQYRGLPKR